MRQCKTIFHPANLIFHIAKLMRVFATIMIMNTLPHDIPLGKSSEYPISYDPGLLFPIPRNKTREALGLDVLAPLPFEGWDQWTGYELSWLNRRGLPQVALLLVEFPCDSPNIIESKSLKLYLNSLNQSPFEDQDHVTHTLKTDLSKACGSEVKVTIIPAHAFSNETIRELEGEDLDAQDIDISVFHPDPSLLTTRATSGKVQEVLRSRLLKTNCPVTNQPDWACVQIAYRGQAIDHAGLLRYIVSYRMHSGFHEQCVEQIFMDIMRVCKPEALSVYARYTRRGGLDINPWRTTPGMIPPAPGRTARQ
jgi:7-cyano-7-deazaguanine reductase